MIDLHAHVVLESLDGAAGGYGPELLDDPVCPTFRVGEYTLEGVRYRGSAFTDVSMRLDSMDALGIEWQMLSPNPLTQLHHVEVATAAEFARRHNDELAGVVALHPSRLGGAAQLPVQAPDLAAAELRRAVGELGLVAAYMGTDIGHEEVLALDGPRMDELWSAAVDLDVPVFLHPAPPGIDAPLADPRLRRFDADLWLAFAYEETLALATLVFGGVLDRHPALEVCISHGGGALLALVGRIPALCSRPWVPEELRSPEAVLERLRRLNYDAHVGAGDALPVLAGVVGEDRLVGGTNLAGWDQPSHLPEPPLADRLDANSRRLLRRRR